MVSVRRLVAVACVVPVFLAAACNEEPTPIMPSPTVEATTADPPSPSPSPTPTVDPLAFPAAAKKPTVAGAKALVRHFWAMVNHLVETGDAGPVRKTYGESCDFCEGGVSVYGRSFEQGHSFEGGQTTVTRLRTTNLSNIGGKTVWAHVTAKSTREVERDADGKVINSVPAGSGVLDFYVTFQSGRWSITNVEVPEP